MVVETTRLSLYLLIEEEEERKEGFAGGKMFIYLLVLGIIVLRLQC